MKFSHIAQLVIVVADWFGRHLAVQLHSYGPHHPRTELGPGGGQWVLPYVAREVRTDDPQLMTVGEAQELLDEGQDLARLAKDAKACAWQLGLGGFTVEHMGSLTQLRRSLRVPDLWMVFRFHRFHLRVHDSFGLSSLADPEMLFGLAHLPLDDLSNAVVASKHAGRRDLCFRGRLLASDLRSLLAPATLPRLLEDPIKLTDDQFHTQETGLVLFTDVAGWGTALQAAGRGQAIDIDGPRNRELFLAKTTESRYRYLSRLSPSHCQDTGDGILAVFHDRMFDPQETAARILAASLDWSASVEQLNSFLPPGAAIGTRFALHHGTYRYGRIGQSLSQSVAVRGQSIVEAARLEAGLGNLLRSDPASATAAGHSSGRHALAISDAALAHCHRAVRAFGGRLVPLGRHTLTAKESAIPADIWRVDLAGGESPARALPAPRSRGGRVGAQ